MKHYIFSFLIIILNSFLLVSQDIAINITEKTLTGNSWTFDLEMTIINAAGGNWGTMNIRNNVQVPSGVLINHSASSLTFTPGQQVSSGTITTFTGGSVAGTDKLGLNLERNTTATNLPVGTTVTLGTFTIIFTADVPASNLITPRPFASTGSGATFYVDRDDPLATRLPFNLYAAQPLPIKLSSFSATKDGDRSARLDWTTSSEINSAYFGIERSTDGINWQAIDRVAAAGNSSNKLDYQYFDRNLPISRSNDHIFYYRLQLVDLDGHYKYSDVRGVNFEGIATTDVISLYPNPTTSLVNIDLRDMDIEQGSIHLIVVDMAGRLILNKTINGNGIEPIDVSRYDAGSYQVLVTQGSQQHQKRFIKAN